MAKQSNVGVYEEGIECTPDSLFSGLAGCFGFLLSLVVVTALGVIAAGVFWTAQNMAAITDNSPTTFMNLRLNGPYVEAAGP